MKIDQTITFKDALNVATQLLNSSDILQKNVEDTLQRILISIIKLHLYYVSLLRRFIKSI
jgi:hypothetical protein